MLKIWCENKIKFYIREIIEDIQQWNFRTTCNRGLDVLMTRFRNGCVSLQGYVFKIKQYLSPYCPHSPNQLETI